MKQYTLHKGERVKKRNDIETLFRTGKSFALFPFRIYYLLQVKEQNSDSSNKSAPLQFGVSVGKKHFKKAVHRNRVKRLVREAYRLQKYPLQEIMIEKKELCLILFFIYTDKQLPDFSLIKEKVAVIIQKLEAQIKK